MPDAMDRSGARRRAIARAVRPDIIAAGKAISSKLADARAHAESALTKGLIDATDGRKTLDRAERSRSLKAAMARLDELADELGGFTGKSPVGLIRDAWVKALEDAWRYAREEAHPDDLNGHEEPTTADVRRARQTVLEGYDARGLIQGAIDTAKRSLKALVPNVATPTLNAKSRLNALKAWQAKTARAIGQATGNAIFTGAYRQDAVAQRLVLKPELIHADPTLET